MERIKAENIFLRAEYEGLKSNLQTIQPVVKGIFYLFYFIISKKNFENTIFLHFSGYWLLRQYLKYLKYLMNKSMNILE